MAWRDTCSDDGRLGQATNVQRAGMYVQPMDFDPSTIADQNANGGQNDVDVYGKPVPDQWKSGSRGGPIQTSNEERGEY